MIDLHTHTTASDGTYTPKELIDYAISKQLKAIAITDHDTVDGLLEARTYLKSLSTSLILINGIEFSASLPGYDFDIHILGYHIDPNNPVFANGLKNILDDRNKRNLVMLEKLNSLGYTITLKDLESHAKDSVITRAHIATVLVEKGYFANNNQAFDQVIGNGKPGYVPRSNVSATKVIQLIKDSNGISALAHPTLYNLSNNGLYSLLYKLKDAGLQGIESYYSLYSQEQHLHMKNLATKFKLIQVGGSDFHGDNKPNLDLKVGYGNLKVPDTLLDSLDAFNPN